MPGADRMPTLAPKVLRVSALWRNRERRRDANDLVGMRTTLLRPDSNADARGLEAWLAPRQTLPRLGSSDPVGTLTLDLLIKSQLLYPPHSDRRAESYWRTANLSTKCFLYAS